MKAFVTGLAATAVLMVSMTSCTADEELSRNNPDAMIRFSVNTANQTRAAHSFCANAMPDFFNVWANYEAEGSKKVYIDGDKVNHVSGSEYQSENVRYWPENISAMSFYAYVDDDNTFQYNDGAPKFSQFTVESNVADQLDLMYAVAKDAAAEQDVVLNFRHALSQICYRAQNENSNIKIKVNSITVGGVAGSGTYNLPAESTTTNYEHHTGEYAAPSEELTRGAWEAISSSDQTSSYEVTPEDGDLAIDGSVTTLTFSGDNDGHTYANALNLIPQSREKTSATDGTPSDGAYFILNLSLTNVADNTETPIVTDDFLIPASLEWEQGNRYIYTFKFPADWTPDNLTPITYEVTVDDFITNPEIELPKQRKAIITGIYDINNGTEVSIIVDSETKTTTADATTGAFSFDLKDLAFSGLRVASRAFKELDMSNLDTSDIINMQYMFNSCEQLQSLDVTHFDTSNVTNMAYMFALCVELLQLDVTHFDTSKVTNMNSMFASCKSLSTLDVTGFDTSKVTDFSFMFMGCNFESLDLSKFNTSSCTQMKSMFKFCESLTSLDLSNFDVSNLTSADEMFRGCDELDEIKTNQAFRNWAIENADAIYLPDAFKETNYEGWVIVDAN